MSAEARYFRVGIFVLVGMVLIVGTVLVLGGRGLFEKTLLFETYFDESVQGLEVGSAVKLRGVQLGNVKEIGFVRDYYSFESPEELQRFGEMVLVLIEIVDPPSGEISPEERERVLRRNIEQGLRMRLAAQGITGMSFIEANYVDPSRHPPREIVWTPRNHYVPSIPSTLTAITSAAERIFQRLEDVDVQKVVEDIDTLVITMTEAVEELNTGQLREEGSRLITDLGRTSAELRTAIHDADVPGLTASAEQTLEQATATLARVQRMVDGGRYDLELALENIRVASENLKDLTDTAREYPSLLLLGEPPERSQAVTR